MSRKRSDVSAGTSAPGVGRPVVSPSVSRRLLIRGATAAVPTILTLNSSVAAAVARTSNDISLNYTADTDALDRHLCVDLTTPPTPPTLIEGNRYDLGDPPIANVTAIPVTKDGVTRVYYVDSKTNSEVVTGPQMCARGGNFYYQVPKGTGSAMEWKQVSVPKGMCASATALSSFSGSGVKITEI